MKAIILAAGRGSRLGPFGADRPKCLTELAGQTLIGRQIATLAAQGVSEVVVVTGHRAEMLDIPGVRCMHNPRWQTTNMVESLFCAEGTFGDDVIVSYGDIVYEPRVLAALSDSPHAIAVAVDRNWRAYWEWRFADPLADAESLRLDGQGRIIEIGAKVIDLARIEAQYMGLMRFRGQGLDALRAARANLGRVRRPWMDARPAEQAYMTDLLMEMVLMGFDVRAVAVAGGWLEFDTADELRRASAMVADGTIRRFFDPDARAIP